MLDALEARGIADPLTVDPFERQQYKRGTRVWRRTSVVRPCQEGGVVAPSGLRPLSLVIRIVWCSMLGAVPPAWAQAPPEARAPVRLTLDQATARALDANLTYKARLLDRDLAVSEIDIAHERPNPDFSYENQRDAPYHAFLLNVPIELGGKRSSRIRLGEASRDVTSAEIGREAADLRAEVRRAFYRLLASDRRAEFARELTSVATRARDAAQARVDSGDAPRLDLVQADLARARVVNAAATIDGERAALEEELDVLVGLPAGSHIEASGELFSDGSGLVGGATTSAPGVDIAAAEGRVRAAEASVGLAKALRVPDLTLGGGLTDDAPPDFSFGWKATAGVTVPLFTTHRAQVTRAEVQSSQATRLAAAAHAEVDGKTAAATSRARTLGDAVSRTTRDILPASRTLTDMAQASYESGQTGMVALLQSLQLVAGNPDRSGRAGAGVPARAGRSRARACRGGPAMTRDAVAPTLLCLGLLAGGCAKPENAEESLESAAPVVVRVVNAGPAHIEVRVRASGTTVAAPGAELSVTAPQQARVVEMPHGEGDRVARGGLLVQFEIPSLAADVAARESALAQANARVANAQAARDRLAGLMDRGVAARREVEDAQRDLAEAEAAVAEDKAGLEAARQLLSRQKVVAPFDGVVVRRWHNPGDLVDASTTDPVLRFADPARIEAEALVPAGDVARIAARQTAEVKGPGDTRWPAMVIATPAAVDAATGIRARAARASRRRSAAAGPADRGGHHGDGPRRGRGGSGQRPDA